MEYPNATQLPYLLNRQQAADFLGVDPVTFDKVFRRHRDFRCFMIGKQARFTIEELTSFVREHLVD
jgi:hypothetical protein